MTVRFTETDKWKDPWFWGLGMAEKLLWVFICENCDSAGFWDVNLDYAAMMTKIPQGEIAETFKAMNGRYLGPKGGTIWLKNFLRHQRNDPLRERNKAHIAIFRIIEGRKTLFPSVYKLAKRGFKGDGRGNNPPLSSLVKSSNGLIGSGHGKTGAEKPTKAQISLEAFEAFWVRYPGRKKGKGAAREAWNGRTAEGVTPEHMNACLDNYIKEIRILETDEKYIMLCATFFGHKKGFEDFDPKGWTPPKPPTKAHEKPQVRGGVAFAEWDKDGKRIYEKQRRD